MTWGDQFLREQADQITLLNKRLRASGRVAPSVSPIWGTVSEKPAWIDPPLGTRYFHVPGVIATPALGSSLTSVLAIAMPTGWDGVVKAISQNYTGGGFVQGSGDLTWTVRVGGAVVDEYNAVATELGSVQTQVETLIFLSENQLYEHLVSVSAGAGIPIAGTQIICYARGYRWPRRTA